MTIRKYLIISMFVICLPHLVMAEEPVRLTNGEWPPYCSQTLKHHGLVSRIVTEAFAVEGIKVEYGFFPWKRALVNVEDGTWDGSPGWYYSEERAQYAYYSDPMIDYHNVIFHLKSTPFDWKEVEDLKGIPIGGTRGNVYGKKIEDAKKSGKLTIEWVTEDEQNFKKLLAGRVQLVLMDLHVGYFLLHTKFTPEERSLITHHPKPTASAEPGHLILSKKVDRSKRLMDAFNRGLQRLKESGKYDQYIAESKRGEYLPSFSEKNPQK